MLKILGDLAQDDYFGLIIFDSAVDVWKAELLQAKEINLKQAKDFVKSITDRGGTVPQGLAFLPEWWEWCIAESELSYRTKGKSSIKKARFFFWVSLKTCRVLFNCIKQYTDCTFNIQWLSKLGVYKHSDSSGGII